MSVSARADSLVSARAESLVSARAKSPDAGKVKDKVPGIQFYKVERWEVELE